eukprot:5647829-Amphidinium_carterae.1
MSDVDYESHLDPSFPDTPKIPISDGTPPTLTPEQTEELKKHKEEGHVHKSPLCEDCIIADGPIRRHRRIEEDAKRHHIMHIDIFGPVTANWE